MKDKKKLSVVITAFNEENNIKDCLESVSFADEIIVIDSSSTDGTKAIAKRFTKHVFTRPNFPMLNTNKNYGFSKATGEWILSLDADERVTDELKADLLSVINDSSQVSGYWIPRKNIIFGKWIEHTGWYPDYQLRLFKNGQGKFEEKHVHEMIQVNGEAATLHSPLLHYNYQTLAQFIHKASFIYAPNEAEVKIDGGYVLRWQDALWFPAKEFISRFFAREGYKDGLHGLVLSMLMAFYHLMVFVYIWEKNDYKQIEKTDILQEFGNEFSTVSKEMRFWLFNERLKQTRSSFQKAKIKFLSLLYNKLL